MSRSAKQIQLQTELAEGLGKVLADIFSKAKEKGVLSLSFRKLNAVSGHVTAKPLDMGADLSDIIIEAASSFVDSKDLEDERHMYTGHIERVVQEIPGSILGFAMAQSKYRSVPESAVNRIINRAEFIAAQKLELTSKS